MLDEAASSRTNNMKLELTDDEVEFLMSLLRYQLCGDDPSEIPEYELENDDMCYTLASKLGRKIEELG
jgi:hypothetical protein